MNLVVSLFAFDDVEVLDFAGPFEVFATASRLLARSGNDTSIRLVTVAPTADPVRARGGLRILADETILSSQQADLLLVPGGVVDPQRRNADVIAWLRAQAAAAKAVASICTGAFLLAEAGLLDRRTATTHWEDIDDLRRMYPATQVIEHARFTDNGSVLTAAGIASGLDLALHLCGRFFGADTATAVARQMEYPWYGRTYS